MIRIVICDDEKHMSDHIRAMDILFLDIQMKGMDGMETARKLRADKFRGFLIFITVLKEMVFQSFEVQAYDYLVKPVEEKQFEKTMERLFASMQNAVEDSLLVQKGYEGRIILKKEIVFCEVIDRKIYLNLASGEVVDYYDRIENLEMKLDSHFFRCCPAVYEEHIRTLRLSGKSAHLLRRP